MISFLIILAGLVSMKELPVAQYPNITPVQIQVTTTYPGADAKTVGDSVAAPIEAQINGVDNMLYMSSTSSNTGQMTITVYFSLDTDPDLAQVLVQNRVNLAMPQLPDSVKQFGVSVQKKSSTTLMIISVFNKDGRYSPDYVTTYAYVYILDAIKRINGAGQAQIFGVPDQAMRIWMDPNKMASLGITTSIIQDAVSSQNKLFGAGQIGQPPSKPGTELNFPVITEGQFSEPNEYADIILRSDSEQNAIVRVRDVARVEVGRKQYIGDNFFNGYPATPIAVYQQPGANGLEVSKAVRRTLKELESSIPDGIEYVIALDTTEFVRISIDEVIHTLVEAILLVIGVVFFFLQSFRATIICSSAIFVALIGTFAGMLALGFSINLLTLFGLVLAIGMVVDDAIVVVENVERNMEEGHLTPKQASIKAMEEVSGPVVAVVLVLCAVFIPAAFLPGTTGQLYKQFAITIVISVTLSGLVALTLTPALCGIMLKHRKPPQKGLFHWFNDFFARATKSYGRGVEKVVKHGTISICLFLVMIGFTVYLFNSTPTSFVPNEDQGYLLGQLFMPDSASLNRTEEAANAVDKIFEKIPGVTYRTIINGYSLIDSQYKSNACTFFVKLDDFDKRYSSIKVAEKENAKIIATNVFKEAQKIDTGFFLPIAPPAIPGIGTTGGFEFWIQDKAAGDPVKLYEITDNFLKEAKKRPELTALNSTFRASTMQLKANVDRSKAVLLNVPINDVYSSLQAQFGSIMVSQYEQFSRIWNVILQSDAPFRETPGDIDKIYVQAKGGSLVPLSALVTTGYSAGPDIVPHFNGFPAAKITGNANPGFSSGEAIQAMQETADLALPENYSYAWSGMAYQEIQSGSTSALAFIFGMLIVFLILAAQYESWSLPCSVLTAVPFGIIGALIATKLRGLENDVYFQIGLLVLVGLAAKNAILIVEFAVDLHKQGKSIIDSAIIAGELRLRPIIMTSLAFIFGVFPLFIAMGAGANARHSIGTGILGGMIGASSLALLYVPLFYVIFVTISERIAGKNQQKENQEEEKIDEK